MIGFPRHIKVFASTQPCDMRKQARSLLAMVQAATQREAAIAELYLFWNRHRNLVKVVYLDANGACMFCKQLDRGRFAIDCGQKDSAAMVSMSIQELSSLLAAAECLSYPTKARKTAKSRTH